MTSCSTPSASGGSGPMSLRVCALAWRRGWLCTTFVSGSTTSSVALGWHSPTCWDGELTTHTKRLEGHPCCLAPGTHSHLLIDIRQVALDGGLREVHLGGYLVV